MLGLAIGVRLDVTTVRCDDDQPLGLAFVVELLEQLLATQGLLLGGGRIHGHAVEATDELLLVRAVEPLSSARPMRTVSREGSSPASVSVYSANLSASRRMIACLPTSRLCARRKSGNAEACSAFWRRSSWFGRDCLIEMRGMASPQPGYVMKTRHRSRA